LRSTLSWPYGHNNIHMITMVSKSLKLTFSLWTV